MLIIQYLQVTHCLSLFCDTRYILPSATLLIKVPSRKPNLPTSLMPDNAASVANTVVKHQDWAALFEINLYLLPSLIQYVSLSVLTAIPEGKLVGCDIVNLVF